MYLHILRKSHILPDFKNTAQNAQEDSVSSWNGTVPVEWSHFMHSFLTFTHSVVEFTKVLTQVNVKFLNHSLTNWLHSISTWVLGL